MGTPDTTKSEDTVDLSKAVKIAAIKPIITSLFNKKLQQQDIDKSINLSGLKGAVTTAISDLKSKTATGVYHAMERLGGETGKKVIPYKLAEKVKWAVLPAIKNVAPNAAKLEENSTAFLKLEDAANISSDEIKSIGDRLGVNWEKINLDQLVQGAKVELEHSDVTDGNLEDTVRIALAHLDELPDYYTRLAQMESGGANSAPTEKGIGSAIISGLKALAPQLPKVKKIPMPKNIMGGALKELDTKYQTVLRQATEAATKKFMDKQNISKQVTHMTPTPEFAQANTGVDQEKITSINTELLNMYQVLQTMETRSKEEGILTEDELNSIIIPLKEELQHMMEALTPSAYEDVKEEPTVESEPERQVGGAERELTYPATNFADKSVPKNDLEKQFFGIGGTGQGRGFHGDPERHAEAARARWKVCLLVGSKNQKRGQNLKLLKGY
jgi:hypothetical protein